MQVVLQRKESGLANPLDMMYHIQPWMILSLLPLSSGFEGVNIATSEFAFGFTDNGLMVRNLAILFAGALLAFMLEMSEFLVVSHSSGLTLSVAGIFKEVITLLLAARINGDSMSSFNAVGLCMCMAGIAIHVVLKALHAPNELKDFHHHHASTQNLLGNTDQQQDLSDTELSHFTSNRRRQQTL